MMTTSYFWIRELVLVAHMDVVDGNLEVVDNLGDELVQEGGVLFFLV